jgi:hypothetical protein
LWVKALIERKHIKAKYDGGIRMLYVPQQTVKKQSRASIRKLINEVLKD